MINELCSQDYVQQSELSANNNLFNVSNRNTRQSESRSNVFIVYTFFSLTVSIVDSEHVYVSWVTIFIR